LNYRKSPERPLKAGERRRTFTDAEGIYWDVRETKGPDYDRRGSMSLIFESINAIRRVRDYPADWYELSEAKLAEISQRT
jgi:hypothetical protein